jgi:hypothetical protein
VPFRYYCPYCKTYTIINYKVDEGEIECGCGGSAKINYNHNHELYEETPDFLEKLFFGKDDGK